MKLSKSKKPSTADLQKTIEIQTIVLVALTVGFVVLVAVVAVLLSQVDGHRISIEELYRTTPGLPASE